MDIPVLLLGQELRIPLLIERLIRAYQKAKEGIFSRYYSA